MVFETGFEIGFDTGFETGFDWFWIGYTTKNFTGEPDFVRCLLVQNGLWPADFFTM